MNINVLEENIESIESANIKEVITFIINAVRDYPVYQLEDTENYFEEIKRLLNVKEITYYSLINYIDNCPNKNDIWVQTSLESLLEAFSLMDIYNFSFKEIEDHIKYLK